MNPSNTWSRYEWAHRHPSQSTSAPADREKAIRRLERLAWLLDDAVRLPGTRVTLGWDSVLGLVPFLGDAATTALAAYFMWEASRLGLSRWTIMKMLGNVAFDFALGTIPLVGDLADIGFRANRRNLKLLHRELGITPPEPRAK